MGRIEVVNIKKWNPESIKGVRVDIFRPNILGNPFHMADESERTQVIEKFHAYLRDEYRKRGKVYSELIRLSNLVTSNHNIYLVCFCAPKLCHGNVIATAIKGIISTH